MFHDHPIFAAESVKLTVRPYSILKSKNYFLREGTQVKKKGTGIKGWKSKENQEKIPTEVERRRRK
jgi:hypothetical protein